MSTINQQCPHCHVPLNLNDGRCRKCRRLVVLEKQYHIIKLISTGGFGSVYLALDLQRQARVAIKLVAAQNPEQYRLIEHEVAVLRERLAGLRFVPQIYGAFRDGSEVYIVMEFIDGVTLDEFRVLPWTAASVRRFLETMLGHLEKIHRHGVIHRDLKPLNIMRNKQSDYVLIDFGIAKQDMETRTMARGSGTIAYASPEQIGQQKTTPQSDLYSLGVTAYELLTGKLPPNAFERLSGQRLRPPSTIVAGVPSRLEATLLALLKLEPHERPASAAHALDLLRDQPPLIQQVPPRRSPPRPNGWLILALVLVLGIFGIGISILSGHPITGPQGNPTTGPIPVVGVPSGRLVFSSRRDGTYELYLADAGGGPPWNQTSTTNEDEHAPTWSGDGSYVTYVAHVNVNGGQAYAIGRLDIATRQRTLLTTPTLGTNYGTPRVSPDGTLIAYNAGPEGNYDLYVMRADGSNPRLIAGGPGHDYHPAWLPDGKRLLYVARSSGGDSLMLVGADAVALGVVHSSSEEINSPAVSPDGTMVAFAMGQSNAWKLYVMPIAGGTPQRVTQDVGTEAERFPAWSADGQSLMFMSTRDHPDRANPDSDATQIYLIDLNGQNLRRIFADSPDDRQPTWRP